MNRAGRVILLLLLTAAMASSAWGKQRFEKPKFTETGHTVPAMNNQDHLPRDAGWEYVDMLVLVGALSVAAVLAIRGRSRGWMLGLAIFCLAYFGFYRQGCVCSIGAVQNVSLGLADSSYTIPLFVIAFFLLPLIFALFVGRVFCGAVCPLGALQDLVHVRTVKLPRWLDQSLGVIPYLYLGAGVLFAVTGTAFIICEYDPFIGFFRFDGPWGVLVFGGVLLAIGMFIGRPYCRFLCPYSVLLRHLSRFSIKHLRITPDDCIQCSLCEDACPFGAIDTPTQTPDDVNARSKMRLAGLVLATPVLILAFGWLASLAAPAFTHWHPEAQRLETWLKGADTVVGRPNRQKLLAEADGDWAAFVRMVNEGYEDPSGDPAKNIVGGKAKLDRYDALRKQLAAQRANGDMTEAVYREQYAKAEHNYRLVDTAMGELPDRGRASRTVARAAAVREELAVGGWFVGGLIGLVIGARLIRFAVYRNRTDYEANKASCLSCNRCLMHCPRERARLGIIEQPVALTANGSTTSEGGV